MSKLPWLLIPIVVAALAVGVSVQYLKSPVAPKVDILQPTPFPTFTPTPSPTSIPTPTITVAATVTPRPTSPPAVSGPPGTGISTITVATEKGNFKATVLGVDLGSSRMITDTSEDNDCTNGCKTLSLAEFVSRNGGFAGVNGSYFCPDTYTDCANKTNTFDSPIYNSRLHKWINGSHLGWSGLSLVYVDRGTAVYHQNSTDYPSNPEAAIVNYPGLVNGGSVQIDDNQSGLSDKQRAVGTKVGIGVVSSSKIIVVVAQNVNMQQFAYVFKALGATGALNLDTGGSTALYSGGYIYGPGRGLPNAIIFARR